MRYAEEGLGLKKIISIEIYEEVGFFPILIHSTFVSDNGEAKYFRVAIQEMTGKVSNDILFSEGSISYGIESSSVA